jgi:alcohol dehydrogenase class IV
MVGAGPQELKDVASALYSGMNGISRRQYVVRIIMQPFSFQTTRSVLSEVGATEKIGSIVAEMGCKKVAFITDQMILDLGLAAPALASLEKAGVGVWTFSDVIADPPEDMILSAVDAARAEGVDGVVSVGGGSSMDTAKLVSVLVQSDQPLSEMYGVGLVKGERLPLVLVPTTAGTGSEVTSLSIVTTGTSEKRASVHHSCSRIGRSSMLS